MTRTVGQLIQEARQSADITQEELARTLGLSRAAINNWEIDRNLPARKRVKALCNALALDVSQFDAVIYDPSSGTGGLFVLEAKTPTRASENVVSRGGRDRENSLKVDNDAVW